MAFLTAEVARNVWLYEPDTGEFYWLISPKYDVAIGSRAGFFDGTPIAAKVVRDAAACEIHGEFART